MDSESDRMPSALLGTSMVLLFAGPALVTRYVGKREITPTSILWSRIVAAAAFVAGGIGFVRALRLERRRGASWWRLGLRIVLPLAARLADRFIAKRWGP
jgi:hypothetical protein